ncbi:hypothetical protein [Bradyrhizobium archetypum]|uniref:Uncharacterized protein n=1 Tax=Bradyrhizobium archetypum TaxID=2721160 RepID=A0A7Y4M1J4_9BRAD|nr:hypothetical protein [Bradyrhizobium archetypum]NOJ45975.1 hypothetical protein [Bradyrhizobium archetypum]
MRASEVGATLRGLGLATLDGIDLRTRARIEAGAGILGTEYVDQHKPLICWWAGRTLTCDQINMSAGQLSASLILTCFGLVLIAFVVLC